MSAIGSEPHARRASMRRGWRARAAGEADDDLLPLFELAFEHFGRAAVGETDGERHGPRGAVGIEHPHAARGAAPRLTGGDPIVPTALLRAQDFPDAGSCRLPDFLPPGAALVVGELRSLERRHLPTAVLQDAIELGLLLAREAEATNEPVAVLGRLLIVVALSRARGPRRR